MEMSWKSLLNSLKQGFLIVSDDKKIIHDCIEALKNCAKLTACFGLN